MVMEYIFLASGCVVVGVVTTFVVLFVCQRLGISIDKHIWVLATPSVFSLILNVFLLELYRRHKNKKQG